MTHPIPEGPSPAVEKPPLDFILRIEQSAADALGIPVECIREMDLSQLSDAAFDRGLSIEVSGFDVPSKPGEGHLTVKRADRTPDQAVG
jgi:hypothetical protein